MTNLDPLPPWWSYRWMGSTSPAPHYERWEAPTPLAVPSAPTTTMNFLPGAGPRGRSTPVGRVAAFVKTRCDGRPSLLVYIGTKSDTALDDMRLRLITNIVNSD